MGSTRIRTHDFHLSSYVDKPHNYGGLCNFIKLLADFRAIV